MIPFITYREKDKTGVLRYYVLQKDFPHNIGVILSQPSSSSLAQCPIPSYNLWVVWDGTLRGNFVQAHPDMKKELQVCMDNMSEWFWSERIVGNEKRYEKFKVK